MERQNLLLDSVGDYLERDPQVSQMMLGLGPAYDIIKNVPIDLLSNIPHFESEVEGSRDDSNARSAGQQPAIGAG